MVAEKSFSTDFNEEEDRFAKQSGDILDNIVQQNKSNNNKTTEFDPEVFIELVK